MTDTLENTSHDIEDPNFDIESVGHTHLPTNTGVSTADIDKLNRTSATH